VKLEKVKLVFFITWTTDLLTGRKTDFFYLKKEKTCDCNIAILIFPVVKKQHLVYIYAK